MTQEKLFLLSLVVFFVWMAVSWLKQKFDSIDKQLKEVERRLDQQFSHLDRNIERKHESTERSLNHLRDRR